MPPRTALPLPFKTLAPTISHRSRAMAAAASGFPTPMTPPYPAISKEVELRRAMTAAARSGAYELGAGDVVFEDESMVVVNKLSGIYCETLLKALSDMAPPLPGNGTNEDNALHLANRLDRDTSGLMVITKSNKVAAKLVKAFTDHKVKKSYIALCIGHAPKWKKLTISSGHGRSKFGAWRVYSKSDVGRTLPGGSMVKDMMTCFEVLSINGQKNNSGDDLNITVESKADESGFGEDEILIRAWPQSGRTHQIRLHCQYLGIPIRGDVKYGGVIEWKGVEFNFHALHAESLSFDHPVSGSSLCFRSPLPLWAKEMITMD